jgi:transcriptional regulator with XRE-family HTH domain
MEQPLHLTHIRDGYLENGDRQPTLTILWALSEGLGLPVRELLRRVEAGRKA